MLAVALGKVFRTAMAGRCDARPELVGRPLAARDRTCRPCPRDGGADLVQRPLRAAGLDGRRRRPSRSTRRCPAWGDSPLRRPPPARAADARPSALSHLYVLLPVLDGGKHYWVGDDEVDKLVRAGGDWLAGHPERELITAPLPRAPARPRRRRGRPAGRARRPPGRALDEDVDGRRRAADSTGRSWRCAAQAVAGGPARRGRAPRRRPRAAARARCCATCSATPAFTEVLGVDVSARALRARRATARTWTGCPTASAPGSRLVQSSLTYRDDRLAGYDAIVLMEVVEHVDPERLPALERHRVRARPSGHGRA